MSTTRLVSSSLCAFVTLFAGATSAQVTASAEASFSVQARAQAAIALPSAAIELRSTGVPAPEVRTALVSMHAHHVPAPEVHVTFTRSVEWVHVHGPHPHFGAFITFSLSDGLRGERLYRAVRVEHERPQWRPPGLAKGHYKGTIHGPPGQRGRADVRGHGPGARVDVRVRGEGPGHMGRVREGPQPHGVGTRAWPQPHGVGARACAHTHGVGAGACAQSERLGTRPRRRRRQRPRVGSRARRRRHGRRRHGRRRHGHALRRWIMQRTLLAAAVALALTVGGCDDEPEDKALRAAAIAAEIDESPGDTEEILEDHDMTIEQFEALMYEVAGDPELSQRYEKARAE